MQLLFRCSRLSDLMTDPKAKKDKDSGVLSTTAKSLVRDMWLKNTYGYEKLIMTNAMKKGLLCEQDSMELVQNVLGGEFRRKHEARLQNDFIIGTPDIVLQREDFVEDVKTSFDIETFFDAKLTDDYFAQAQGYMELTGKKNYRLIYCLVPTPAEIMESEEKRIWYKFINDESNPDYQKYIEQFRHNNDLISSIPDEKRVKIFTFGYEEIWIAELYKRIEKAREYYKELEL